jgi:hypothetical protein
MLGCRCGWVSDEGFPERHRRSSGNAVRRAEWQRNEFEAAQAIFADWDRFEKLPTKYDIHEWGIMREFAESVEPERLNDELQNTIHGAGAFRYFKDTLRRYRREKDWYAYRTEVLRDIAIEWCEENGVAYTES